MDFKQIQELIKMISKSNITELKIEEEHFKITIKAKEGAGEGAVSTYLSPVSPVIVAPPVAAAPPVVPTKNATEPAETERKSSSAESSDSYFVFKSPMIGTFYRSAGPDKEPFVKVGDSVDKGQVICIVEAMKLFNEIESEVGGKIVKVLVDNASPVEYDQPLFWIDTNG